MEELLKKITELEDKVVLLETELVETKEHLKKYTAPTRGKKYYEKNKEKLLENMKANPPSPEQIKEKNKRAYLKRKEKLKLEMEKIEE